LPCNHVLCQGMSIDIFVVDFFFLVAIEWNERVIYCMQLFVLVGISTYVKNLFELRSRIEYVMKKEKCEDVVMKLMAKEPSGWQHAIVILLLWVVCWQIVLVYLDPMQGAPDTFFV
jgi:accessory gene regulator protein AgrB